MIDSLDSDGDGCLDVLEAGFEDGDKDGIIGSGTPSVDTSGKVEGHEYDTPLDTDSDGTKDFLQVSSQSILPQMKKFRNAELHLR